MHNPHKLNNNNIVREREREKLVPNTESVCTHSVVCRVRA